MQNFKQSAYRFNSIIIANKNNESYSENDESYNNNDENYNIND